MIKWPEKLRNGREAGKLPGIGPSISAKLDERLRSHQAEFGIVTEIPDGAIIFAAEEAEETPVKRRTATKSAKDYVPSYRSASYSVLVALLLHLQGDPQNGPLNKSELTLKAQCYSTSPLNDGIFPSINSALKVLEEKELIGKIGNPAHYTLTVKGLELAEKLWQKGEKRPSQGALAPINPSRLYTMKAEDSKTAQESDDPVSLKGLELFTWLAGTFEIVLLIDVREIRSREDRNYLTERLGQLGITSEVRNLELGDFIWVARKRNSSDSDKRSMTMTPVWTDTEEIVLDTLIERKREDDLIASISDGRYREQKHRISRSLLSSTFYLVERTGTAAAHEFLGGAEERLLAATLQCQVIDGLMYRQTSGLDESIVFLAAAHKQLRNMLEKTDISACKLKASDFCFKQFPKQFPKLKESNPDRKVFMNYTAYALLNAKSTNQSLADVFLRQLMTINGVTFDKACTIIEKYPTPLKLHEFYQNLQNELAKEDAFKDFPMDKRMKRFGVALSKKIYEVFGKRVS
jgi:crossover junction endonuclease MUS81